MKIGESRPVTPLRQAYSRPDAAGGVQRGNAVAGVSGIADTTSVMGLSESDLTPKVRDAIMALMAEVERLREEVARSRARVEYLEKLADQDSMVPVANRRAFIRELSRMMSFATRYGQPSSILYFDLNDLKVINDTHGHAAGDAVIALVADLLLEHTRESDIVGRLGGDEFGIILAQADQDLAQQKSATLSEAIQAAEFEWKGERIGLSAAVGAFTFRHEEDAGEVLEAADRAMYERKRQRSASAS